MALLSNYRDREHWSFSSLNQFLNICSLQWAFQRAYKIAPAFTSVALSFGNAFHRVTEWVNLQRKESKFPKPKDAAELFDDLFVRQLEEDKDVRFDEGELKEDVRANGRNICACLVENLNIEEQVLRVNDAFAVPMIDADGNALEKPLIGEIDAIVSVAGEINVVDYKSSGRRWPKDKAAGDLQPTACLYALNQRDGVRPKFRFDVLVKNKTPVFEQHSTERTDDHFNRMVELVKRIESMVRKEHFLPNEHSFYCAGCAFQEPCKAWHRGPKKFIKMAVSVSPDSETQASRCASGSSCLHSSPRPLDG